jgi:hypothetical protein
MRRFQARRIQDPDVGYISRMQTVDSPPDTVYLRGRAFQVALAVGMVLLGIGIWAGAADLASEYGTNSVPLEVLSLLYRLLSIAALLYVAARWHSRSLRILALLLALLELGHLLVHNAWFNDTVHLFLRPVVNVLPVSMGLVRMGGMFIGLGVLGIGLVWLAFRQAGVAEKPVVVRIIAIIGLLGFFAGPVNAISAFGINKEWLVAEDLGQVLALAVLAAYGAGLVVATRERPGSLA